jgi:hypothetical protein
MSDVQGQVPVGRTTQVPSPRQEERPEPTLWTGWVLFGAMILVLLGSFQAINGLVALFNESYFVAPRQDLVVTVSYDTWGWVHLVLGLIALATGIGLMRGAIWARVTGVIIAMLSAIVNLAFIAAFPVWAILMISLDVIVIYAITTHGGELNAARM